MNKQHIFSSHYAKILSSLILIAIALITLLAYGSSYYGWQIYLELLAHFQVQYFICTLFLLSLLILLGYKKQIYLGIFLCAVFSAQIFPWYVFPSRLFTSGDLESDLKVLVANVNTQNKNYDKVINLVREEKPDIAIFLEVDQEWQAQLDTLGNLLPYSSVHCNYCNSGVLLYSKQQLDDSRVEFFGAEKNSSVIAQIRFQDQPITIVATHPFPPLKPEFFQSRNQQIDSIGQYLGQIDHHVILAGDLNMSMWSPYYRRLINQTGLNNTRKGFGILPSWSPSGAFLPIPDWAAFFLQIPIDHCLVSKGFEVSKIYTGEEMGSDHLPLIVNLTMTAFPS